MDIAAGWRRHGRAWLTERPWLFGAATAAVALGLVLLAASFEQQRPQQAAPLVEAAEPRPLEIPRGFPRPQVADRRYYAAAASPVARQDTGRTSLSWSFGAGLPTDWRVAPGEGAPQPELWRTTDGIAVETTATRTGYQLTSQPRHIEPGRWVVNVDVGVVSGGIMIGVLDTAAGTWLATRLHWSGQRGVEGRLLQVPFSLTYDTSVQIVLANWARLPRRSLWEVRSLELLEAAAPPPLTAVDRAYYAERAAPLQQPSLPVVERWPLDGGLPEGWVAVGGAVLAAGSGELAVATGSGSFDYQLQSPPVTLPPGRYEVVVHGTIADGGMLLGALDVGADEWVATRTFWQEQQPGAYVVPFSLQRGTEARIVLTNWSRRDRTSQWRLSAIELRRQPS